MKTVYIYFNTDGYAEQWDSQPQVGYEKIELDENHDYFKGNWSAYIRKGKGIELDQQKLDELTKAKDAQGQKDTPEMAAIKELRQEVQELKALVQMFVGEDPDRAQRLVKQFAFAIGSVAQSVPETKALEMPDLYQEWQPNVAYAANQILKVFVGNPKKKPDLFKVMQAHTSQKQ